MSAGPEKFDCTRSALPTKQGDTAEKNEDGKYYAIKLKNIHDTKY